MRMCEPLSTLEFDSNRPSELGKKYTPTSPSGELRHLSINSCPPPL